MMDLLAIVVLIALGLWLANGAPVRRKHLTDEQKLDQRKREALRKENERIQAAADAYHLNDPTRRHWWM